MWVVHALPAGPDQTAMAGSGEPRMESSAAPLSPPELPSAGLWLEAELRCLGELCSSLRITLAPALQGILPPMLPITAQKNLSGRD